MYEAMQLLTEGSRTFSFKVRKGYYHHLDKAKEAAQKAAERAAKSGDKVVPYVQLNGQCVWSPLTERLGFK